jgi:transcriptional regulator with XRE-family HTH domain
MGEAELSLGPQPRREDATTFGALLRIVRRESGMSLLDVVRKIPEGLNITTPTLSSFERGKLKPSGLQVKAIGRVFAESEAEALWEMFVSDPRDARIAELEEALEEISRFKYQPCGDNDDLIEEMVEIAQEALKGGE